MVDLISTSNIFDDDYIYDYLSERINTAKRYDDLHNLVHDLLPFDELQTILSHQVTKLRSAPSKQTDTNRSLLQQLYIRSASIEDIFSDDILVNVIRFLPSNHYPQMSCISKHFRHIMRTYPSIYTRYTVHVTLDQLLLNNNGVLWVAINHASQLIRVVHKLKTPSMRNDSLSVRRQMEEDAVLRDPKAITFKIRNIEDINTKVPFLWYCCKKWNIESMKKIPRKLYMSGASSAYTSSVLSYKSMVSNKFSLNTNTSESIKPTVKQDMMKHQRDENNLFMSILRKSSTYIESLCVDNINDKDGAKWDLLNDLSLYKLLNHLTIKHVIHNLILESWLNTPQQLLSIQYLQLNHLNITHRTILKQLIEACTNLMVFDCYIAPNTDQTDGRLSIVFPKHMQFIRLEFVFECFQIDLSQCEELCALYLHDTLSEPTQSVRLPLDTIQSGGDLDVDIANDDVEEQQLDVSPPGATVVYDNIEWPETGGIECLLLEQAMDDAHNVNMSLPIYVNTWYDALKHNHLIPVRCIRYITHPFMDMIEEATQEDEEDDTPGPPQLNQGIPIRVSERPNNMLFTSIKYNDHIDPLKYEKDKINFITLEQVKNSKKNCDYKNDIIRVLDGDEDEVYIGYLWKLLLGFKYKHEGLNETLKIYQHWFDIGVGKWIQDLGADCSKHDLGNAALQFWQYSTNSYGGSLRPGGYQ